MHSLESGIFSYLLGDADIVEAVTLEHAYPEGEIYIPKIPSGSYKCVRGPHRLHGMTEDFITFEITGVEGHTNLLFHWGNYNKDSEGCVLLGKTKILMPDGVSSMITESRAAFNKFMDLQNGLDEFQLEVQE